MTSTPPEPPTDTTESGKLYADAASLSTKAVDAAASDDALAFAQASRCLAEAAAMMWPAQHPQG